MSPLAVDFFSSPLRSVNGPPVAQVKHQISLNRRVKIIQTGAASRTNPRSRSTRPGRDGYDVHSHLVSQAATASAWPPTSPAATSTMRSPRKLLRLGHGSLEHHQRE